MMDLAGITKTGGLTASEVEELDALLHVYRTTRSRNDAIEAYYEGDVMAKDIGIDRELFRQSLLQGYTVRPRYSIMQYAKDQGRLEMIAEKITADIYD